MTSATGSYGKVFRLSLAFVAVMAALSAYGWVAVPPGASIAVRWGIDGNPEGFAGKPFALLLMPVIGLCLTIVLNWLPRIDPRRRNLAQSTKAYTAVWLAVMALLTVVHAGIVAQAVGVPFDVARVAVLCAGVVFLVIGNYMGKVRSNFFLGVRTPWTLSSDWVWDRTHRLAGPLFVALGLVTVLAGLVLPITFTLVILIVGVLGVSGFLIAWSYILWRRLQDGTVDGEGLT